MSKKKWLIHLAVLALLIVGATTAAFAVGGGGATAKDDAPPVISDEGIESLQISWEEALRLLKGGTIVEAGQTHSLRVTLVDEQGRRYAAQEPEIDSILRAVQSLDRGLQERIAVFTE